MQFSKPQVLSRFTADIELIKSKKTRDLAQWCKPLPGKCEVMSFIPSTKQKR